MARVRVTATSFPTHTSTVGESAVVMPNGNKPAAKFRNGSVTATVWQNESHYNVVLSKSYKQDEEWKDTDQLSAGDLMNGVRALQRANEFIEAQS